MLKSDTKDVKALLILYNAPAHPSESTLVSHDGKMFSQYQYHHLH